VVAPPVTASATPSPAAGTQTWSATIPAAQVGALGDGTLTASASYTVVGGTIGGASLGILKDLSAPSAPTATPSPAAGPFDGTQSVTLSDPDATAAIHWTNDGSTPTAASPVLARGAAIAVSSSQTIRAVAIDPAGNAGPVAAFAFTIKAPAAAGGGAVTPPSPGATTIIQQIPLLLPIVGGNGVAGNRVTAPARPAVSGLRVSVARGHALHVSLRLGRGANVVRFQVFKARNGRASGRALVTLVRLPTASGRYAVTLRGAALRALRSGRYVLAAQAGANRAALGAASRATFALR
jgi:hypothetical protein